MNSDNIGKAAFESRSALFIVKHKNDWAKIKKDAQVSKCHQKRTLKKYARRLRK